MALWDLLTESISQYTGLSPAAFFTILALMFVTYKVVSGMFVAANDYTAVKRENEFVLREPVQMGDVTEVELRAYDGADPNKPLLMAIKGQIYDVSRSRYTFRHCYSIARFSSSLKIFALLNRFVPCYCFPSLLLSYAYQSAVNLN